MSHRRYVRTTSTPAWPCSLKATARTTSPSEDTSWPSASPWPSSSSVRLHTHMHTQTHTLTHTALTGSGLSDPVLQCVGPQRESDARLLSKQNLASVPRSERRASHPVRIPLKDSGVDVSSFWSSSLVNLTVMHRRTLTANSVWTLGAHSSTDAQI